MGEHLTEGEPHVRDADRGPHHPGSGGHHRRGDAHPLTGYDAGGLLQGGHTVIPAATLHPAPQLTPEQVAAYTRVVELARRWHARESE